MFIQQSRWLALGGALALLSVVSCSDDADERPADKGGEAGEGSGAASPGGAPNKGGATTVRRPAVPQRSWLGRWRCRRPDRRGISWSALPHFQEYVGTWRHRRISQNALRLYKVVEFRRLAFGSRDGSIYVGNGSAPVTSFGAQRIQRAIKTSRGFTVRHAPGRYHGPGTHRRIPTYFSTAAPAGRHLNPKTMKTLDDCARCLSGRYLVFRPQCRAQRCVVFCSRLAIGAPYYTRQAPRVGHHRQTETA